MNDLQRQKLSAVLDEVCAFGVGDIVAPRIAPVLDGDEARWLGSGQPDLRWIIAERVIRACDAGPQVGYYCAAWTRNGNTIRPTTDRMIAECELELSGPFELPKKPQSDIGDTTNSV